jgi:epidermal growth factor receptor substrate 15
MVGIFNYFSINKSNVLGRDLADTQNRGSLDSTDFVIGMHLITASVSGQFSCTSTSLPPGLYEQVSDGIIVSRGMDDSGPFSSRSSPIRAAPQNTGPCALQAQTNGLKGPSPILPSTKPTAPVQAPNAFSNVANPFSTDQPAWDITATEKASADMLFDTLDSLKENHIEGDVAAPVMLQSGLPVDTLARVW